MRLSTKNLAHCVTGWYLTVVQMVWLIAQRKQDSLPTHALIGKGEHPDIVPWVCDGLIQAQTAMKQHCIGELLFTGYGGLKIKTKMLVRAAHLESAATWILIFFFHLFPKNALAFYSRANKNLAPVFSYKNVYFLNELPPCYVSIPFLKPTFFVFLKNILSEKVFILTIINT